MSTLTLVDTPILPQPFDTIPNELLSLILLFASSYTTKDYKPCGRSMRSLRRHGFCLYWDFRVILLLVCRRWRQIAMSCPSVWADLRCRMDQRWLTFETLNSVWETHLARAGPVKPIAIQVAVAPHQESTEPVDRIISRTLPQYSSRIKFLHYATEVPTPSAHSFVGFLNLSAKPSWDTRYNNVTSMTSIVFGLEKYAPPLPSDAVLRFLTHVEIVHVFTSTTDNLTFVYLPALSRLQYLTHLTFTHGLFTCPCSSRLTVPFASRPLSKLPFQSLLELSLRDWSTECLYFLGLMDAPKLRILGLEKLDQSGKEYDYRCYPCALKGPDVPLPAFPTYLPSLTHVVLFGISEQIFAAPRILTSAPALSHLVIRLLQPKQSSLSTLTSIPQSFERLDACIQSYSELQELGIYSGSCSTDQIKAVIGQLPSSLQKLRIGSKILEYVEMRDVAEIGRVKVVVGLDPNYEEEIERMRRR